MANWRPWDGGIATITPGALGMQRPPGSASDCIFPTEQLVWRLLLPVKPEWACMCNQTKCSDVSSEEECLYPQVYGMEDLKCLPCLTSKLRPEQFTSFTGIRNLLSLSSLLWEFQEEQSWFGTCMEADWWAAERGTRLGKPRAERQIGTRVPELTARTGLYDQLSALKYKILCVGSSGFLSPWEWKS